MVMTSDSMVMFFFFFQAEDGIRDTSVTGVQTCALPIYSRPTAEIAIVEVRVTRTQADQNL